MEQNFTDTFLSKISSADKVLIGIGEEWDSMPDGAKKQVILAAYSVLETLVRDKDYFIVSMVTDPLIYETTINSDKVVQPCGRETILQCEKACTDELYDTEKESERSLERCPHCFAPLVPNTIQANAYIEKGYLPQWEVYTKWLQKTLNQELVILELGCNLKYPSVIRWPFEKIAFFNQKSTFYRIHESLYQISEEIAVRAYSKQENSACFLSNLFV